MPKDDSVYLGHMLDIWRKILAKTTGIDRAGYDADENLRLALVHLIQMIGEAARAVSQGFRARNPQIPWRQIIGMRHIVVHDYLNVDEDIVWDVTQLDIAPLKAELEKLVAPGGSPP